MSTELAAAAVLAVPLALLAAGTAAGLLVRRALDRRLGESATGGAVPHELLLRALRGSAVLWCVTLALFLAAELTDLPPALGRVVPSALVVMLIASFTWALARVAGGLVARHEVVGRLPAATLLTNLTRLFVMMLGLLVILQTLGISITPMITALGVGGLAVALALQETLANLFAGVHLLASRQVRPGDFLRLDTGQEGYVQDVSWRYTSIRQLPNNIVVVPNARLASAVTVNFNRPDSRVTFPVALGVTYDTDLDRAERVALSVAGEVLREVPGGVPEFAPLVRYSAFGESRIQLDVLLQAREFAAQGLLRHELIKRLHQRFRAAGVRMRAETAPSSASGDGGSGG